MSDPNTPADPNQHVEADQNAGQEHADFFSGDQGQGQEGGHDQDFGTAEPQQGYDQGHVEEQQHFDQGHVEEQQHFDQGHVEEQQHFEQGQNQQHFDQGHVEEQQHFDQGHVEPQQHFDQGYDQGHGGFDQGHFDTQQNQGYFDQGQPQAQAGGYDDFFGTQSKQQAEPVQYGSTTQPAYGGGYGMSSYDPNYDPEEEERQERLRRREQERNQRLDQKAREERDKKQDKLSEAARELAKWHSERETNIEKKKQINLQNQDLQNQANNEEDYKNPWDKIVGNIATKEGEYPGTKDVTRFRQSIINKKTDVAKGINVDVAQF